MFKQGPLPAFLHGIIEYIAAAVLIAAPLLMGFDADAAIAVGIVSGVLLLILTASSALPTGLIHTIPVQAHVVLDYLLALALIASPFLFGFSDDGTATPFFIAFGVVYLLVTIATRFVRGERGARGAARA
jgi:hypothetical protein